MLENLVGVGDVEAVIVVGQAVDVAFLNRHVGEATIGGHLGGLVDHRLFPLDPDHLARSHQLGEIGRDRSRSAADVEESLARLQVREEVGR